MFKETRWAREIVAQQGEDGLWGYFHTLSAPVAGVPLTTEQALRRLEILGFSADDPPVARALGAMRACLRGERRMPDRREVTHDWDLFTELMLATWIRRFAPDDLLAKPVARRWAQVITAAFEGGPYSDARYKAAYTEVFGKPPRGARFEDFVSFYPVSLLAGELGAEVEGAMFDYILDHPNGLYYLCDRPRGDAALRRLPGVFASRQASRYIGAIELLAAYRRQREKLRFAADWLEENRRADGLFDMGASARDGVYFPLSDSWSTAAARRADCSFRLGRLLRLLESP